MRLERYLCAMALALAPLAGCSSDTSGSSHGTGGSSAGSGGATSTGGTLSSAGFAGTSGQSGSGGVAGTGGRLGPGDLPGTGGRGGAGGTTGGQSGSGGVAGTGGRLGPGDLPGTGGRGGAGGATSQPGTAGTKGTGGDPGRDGSAGGASGTGGQSAGGTSGSRADGGATSDAVPSAGCGKAPTLKNSPSSTWNYNTLTSGGASRQYILRYPSDYDNRKPYRLILGFHGANENGTRVAGQGFFGLWDLSNGSTIFIAPDAVSGLWSASADTTFVDDILKQVEADLCIDTSRVELEGFSMGAAMTWTLTCSRPKVFRAVVGHSGGGVANPTTCQPVAYLGSLGLSEGNGQNTQTDQFAKFDGCTIETLPRAPTGGHVCTNYNGCPAGYPVRWCSYDGGHTSAPKDSGQSSSWMPKEVWAFLSQF